MNFKYFVLILLVTTSVQTSLGQSSWMPFHDYNYHLLDRYSILHGDSSSFYTALKPWNRSDVAQNNVTYQPSISTVDVANKDYIRRDNFEFIPNSDEFNRKPVLKHFYKRENAFFFHKQPDFFLLLNPVLGITGGKEIENKSTMRNTRGFEFRGFLGSKIGFYSYLTENQFRLPSYQREQVNNTGVVPGYGFFKNFGDSAYDMFQARAYVTMSPLEQIRVQFGHDQLFIGNGYRSLIWGNQLKEHLFLKFHTRVWRLQYMNVFSELSDLKFVSGGGDGIEKKYSAFHYLGLDLVPGKLDIGFFEHIIFKPRANGFELNYLNPIVFYRSVEHGLNSSDNALMGMDWKWNFLKTAQLYGQVVIDEFKKDSILKNTGWWGNKWAIQLGGKWMNAFGLKNLDFQIERNVVRPYTFTHSDEARNAIHYDQPLTHPLGANFKENIFIVRYQPYPKWNARLMYIQVHKGLDSSFSSNTRYGGNILADYTQATRPRETGIDIGQGISQNLQIFDVLISYRFWHGAFFDFRYVYRNNQVDAPFQSKESQYVGLGLRLNLDVQRFDY